MAKKLSLLLASLTISLVFFLTIVMPTNISAQSVNRDGDVIFLDATSQTSTATTSTTAIGSTASPTTFKFGNSTITIPAGFFPDFKSLLTWLLQVALIISVLLVLFQLVFAGVNWITSGGDKGKTDSARSRIVAAIIGLIIVVASWAIFLFILQIIGISPANLLPMLS